MSIQQQEHFTENTLFKVYDVLRAAGLTEEQSREAINQMQNQGILFRERVGDAKKPSALRTVRGRRYPVDAEEDIDD